MPKKKEEKIVEAVIEEKVKSKQEEKPYFFPRAIAYIIDILIVSVICTGIMFILPKNHNYQKYTKEYEQIQANFIEKNMTFDEYIHKSIDVVYDIDYSNVLSMIVEVVMLILYFIVFQFYNKGQTLGKKLMKLRLVSVSDENLTLNQVAYRSLINNTILINILIIGSLLFIGKQYYYYASLSLQFTATTILFITLMMILFRKDGRGLHDVISKTKIVQER